MPKEASSISKEGADTGGSLVGGSEKGRGTSFDDSTELVKVFARSAVSEGTLLEISELAGMLTGTWCFTSADGTQAGMLESLVLRSFEFSTRLFEGASFGAWSILGPVMAENAKRDSVAFTEGLSGRALEGMISNFSENVTLAFGALGTKVAIPL